MTFNGDIMQKLDLDSEKVVCRRFCLITDCVRTQSNCAQQQWHMKEFKCVDLFATKSIKSHWMFLLLHINLK